MAVGDLLVFARGGVRALARFRGWARPPFCERSPRRGALKSGPFCRPRFPAGGLGPPLKRETSRHEPVVHPERMKMGRAMAWSLFLSAAVPVVSGPSLFLVPVS